MSDRLTDRENKRVCNLMQMLGVLKGLQKDKMSEEDKRKLENSEELLGLYLIPEFR